MSPPSTPGPASPRFPYRGSDNLHGYYRLLCRGDYPLSPGSGAPENGTNDFLESARHAGYATKVFFISTEDPNLNVGRILIRMSRGGQSVPLEAIPDSYEDAMQNLPNARRHADDLLVYDNTPKGGGHRLVARFIAAELVKTTNTAPEWLRNVFGRDRS